MLLELNVYWWPENYDPEEWEERGEKLVMTLGIMVVNTNHIVAFDPHIPSGETMVHLTNGESFHSDMKFQEFRKIMESESVAKDMFVSGTN